MNARRQGDRPGPGTVFPKRRRARRSALLAAILLGAGVATAYALGWHEVLSLEWVVRQRMWLKAAVSERPVLSYLTFVGIYIGATLLSLPSAAILTISAGFLFGWLAGAAAAMTGAIIGSTLVFLIARSAFGRYLRGRVQGRVAQFAMGFEANAFTYLLALRIAPVLPFFLMNIVPAMFNVPLRTYVAATAIGIIPGALAYSWLGLGLDSVIVAASEAGRTVTLREIVTPQILIAFAALAVVATLPTIVRRLRGK